MYIGMVTFCEPVHFQQALQVYCLFNVTVSFTEVQGDFLFKNFMYYLY
jgi:hypothetical protein